MKKFVFATLMVSAFVPQVFASGNVEPKRQRDLGIQFREKVLTVEALDCRNRGGNCMVIVTIDGITRTIKACCHDIIVIPTPPPSN